MFLNLAIFSKNRKDLYKKLMRNGIDTQKTWLKNIPKSGFPISKQASKELLYINIDESLNEDNLNEIKKSLNKVFK